MKVFVAHCFVIPWRVVFGKVVGHVRDAFTPDELKLALFDAVPNPIEAHIECLRELLAHGGVQDACGCRIVIVDGCASRWLGVS